MKHQYPQSTRQNSLGGLLKLLGAITALILLIGFMDKAGIKVVMDKNQTAHTLDSRMPENDGQENRHETRTIDLDRTATERPDYRSSSQRKRPAMSDKEWVEQFAGFAREQALQRGVPAGITLAAGLEARHQGKRIDSRQELLQEVVAPLSRLKQEVPQDAMRAYFKYSANSERWAQGLGRYSRFSEQGLMAQLSRFGLNEQDEIVTDRLLNRTDTERRSAEVADAVTSRRVEKREAAPRQPEQRSEAQEEDPALEEWEAFYEEEVGREVAREIARRKLRSGEYISEEDMEALVEETNQETGETMQHNIGLMGRRINPDHADAGKLSDITRPENAQARQELYQRKLREHRIARDGQK